MGTPSKEPIRYKGRWLVAQLEKDGKDYTRVLGRVEGKKDPTYGSDKWNKSGTKMVPIYTSRHTRVYCVPVERNERLDRVLKKLEFKQTNNVVDYSRNAFSSYIDEKIIHPNLGFKVMYLALISLEERKAIMDTIFPPNLVGKKEITAEDLTLDLFK
jgi:hypothetical protein